MDDLDRLFRRVAHNVRAAYPELITQSFEVSQLYQQVVPYRLNRRELGVETVEDYELALMQLLSGARGYLTGDADMQRALQDELESLNPDLSAYRAFASSHVAISADAIRAIDQQPVTHPVGTPVAVGAADSAVAARATERIRTSRDVGAADSPGLQIPTTQATAGATHLQPSATMTPKSGVSPSVSAASPSAPGRAIDVGDGESRASACRYCGGSLPTGKNIVFCPHCGHDLTVQHCPACNTELEIGWRFCITCGRQVS
jgi:hypothetical protein